jgi:hypothetical protein
MRLTTRRDPPMRGNLCDVGAGFSRGGSKVVVGCVVVYRLLTKGAS